MTCTTDFVLHDGMFSIVCTVFLFSERNSRLKYLFRSARFFIIKSNNYENVALAKARGIWSTPPQNEARLNQAFRVSGQPTAAIAEICFKNLAPLVFSSKLGCNMYAVSGKVNRKGRGLAWSSYASEVANTSYQGWFQGLLFFLVLLSK